MNLSSKHIFLALGATAILASCSENAWNDKLDGFEAGVNYDKVVEGEFTMSAADYKAVASNSTNKELAKAAGLDNALKAVGTTGVFSAAIPAKEYLPAFLASSSAPYFLAPEGSRINVTYQQAGEVNPLIAEVAAAKKYTVKKADYISAWESDEDYIEAFAPMTPASAALPSILLTAYPDAAAGQMAVVTYNEADENPIFVQLGGGDAPIDYSETFAETQGDFLTANVTSLDFNVWNCAGGNYGMKASAYYNKTNFESEAWLVSPVFNLTGSTATFSFEEATNYFADVETAKNEATVWVRANGGAWTQLAGYAFPSKMSWDFIASGDIDLSAYCGGTVQIGFCYKSTSAKCGTWEVKNFVFKADAGTVEANPGYSGKPAKVLASTPVAAQKTGVYKFNGSKWAAASDVVALDAADYAAMGFANGKLEKPEVYIPLYLKSHCPYAVEGDMMGVVYNGTNCVIAVFDGQNWSVNNDDLQTQTGQFVKEKDGWRFAKLVGKAYFNLTTELVMGGSYLFVAEGICAIPQGESKTYGYLYTEAVSPTGGVIEMKNETNAFTFTDKVNVDDKTYKLSDGKFFIIDVYGRLLYMAGTYDSFNLAKSPATTESGEVDPAYGWTAQVDADGHWTISNAGNGKWIQYSTSYTSWGSYSAEKGVLPQLYMLASE